MSGSVREIVLDHGASWSEWVPVASAAIAASAALASWRAVRQASRVWHAGLLPDLLPTVTLAGGIVSLSVENAGGGPARFASFAVVAEGHFAEGSLSQTGYLRAGDGVVVRTDVPLSGEGFGDVQGAVFCEDRFGRQHAWSFDGAHEVYDAHPSALGRAARWITRRSKRGRRAVIASLYSDPRIRSDR